jgi:hypothetical protein
MSNSKTKTKKQVVSVEAPPVRLVRIGGRLFAADRFISAFQFAGSTMVVVEGIGELRFEGHHMDSIEEQLTGRRVELEEDDGDGESPRRTLRWRSLTWALQQPRKTVAQARQLGELLEGVWEQYERERPPVRRR